MIFELSVSICQEHWKNYNRNGFWRERLASNCSACSRIQCSEHIPYTKLHFIQFGVSVRINHQKKKENKKYNPFRVRSSISLLHNFCAIKFYELQFQKCNKFQSFVISIGVHSGQFWYSDIRPFYSRYVLYYLMDFIR